MRQKQQLTMLDKQTGCRNFRKHWTIARETMMYKCSYIKCGKLQQCLMIKDKWKMTQWWQGIWDFIEKERVY